jgi:hypothetical protein
VWVCVCVCVCVCESNRLIIDDDCQHVDRHGDQRLDALLHLNHTTLVASYARQRHSLRSLWQQIMRRVRLQISSVRAWKAAIHDKRSTTALSLVHRLHSLQEIGAGVEPEQVHGVLADGVRERV